MPRRLVLLLLLLVLAGCGERKGEHQELRVGMELAYPPFEMADESGQPSGVSVDLARALGEALGRPVRIENLPFHGLLPALKTGKIDCIISSMTVTDERKETIDFSEPYVKTGLALLVPAGSSVRSIEDLRQGQPTIVTKKGTTGYFYANQHLPQARALVLDKESACVMEVAQGKAAAFLYDQLSIWKAARQYPEATRPLLTPFQQEAWAIGVRQGEDALRGQINTFLRDYRAKGGFDQLGERWLGEQKAAFAKLGVPFVF